MNPMPTMSNGKTYADEEWWAGRPEFEAPQHPTNLAEAEALVWARCWAYGVTKDMSIREWHLMWPIVYATIHAFNEAAARETPPLDGTAEGETTGEGGGV